MDENSSKQRKVERGRATLCQKIYVYDIEAGL